MAQLHELRSPTRASRLTWPLGPQERADSDTARQDSEDDEDLHGVGGVGRGEATVPEDDEREHTHLQEEEKSAKRGTQEDGPASRGKQTALKQYPDGEDRGQREDPRFSACCRSQRC